ncbi:STAS domain-containing protein [Sediminispirochaeta bajacaliforniensis]|uniref:STAS domain-containing protein n=1 Tax=Sediminispirochaeta bajacaliforniensis TaxID=148 RepID=UPI00035FAFAE|nr:STAS domain-containing protein [Sediminispirochaeta bajacaliforniensis]
MERGRYFVAEREGITFIRMVGNLKYTGSSAFDMFLDDFLSQEYRDVVVDLSDAIFIDSTNLGLLARIAERSRRMGKPSVTLISPHNDINRILRSVRFDRIFHIVSSLDTPESLEELEVGGSHTVSKQNDNLNMILRAHKALINLDDANRHEFQDVVDLLEQHQQKQNG